MDLNSQLDQKQPRISLELPLISLNDEEGYNLRALVHKALNKYNLDYKCGLQVDYWSNSMQTYILCDDIFEHDSSKPWLIPKEDLIYCEKDDNGEVAKSEICLLLRIKNCTGNVILLDEEQPMVGPLEMAQSQIALSIDHQFKNQRNRTVKQVVDMVLRWRTVCHGYYDYQIERYVEPITYEQAAINLSIRHKVLTGEDQHIERKTLDDYYDKVKWGNEFVNPYNFTENQDRLMKHLRRHCEETRNMI